MEKQRKLDNFSFFFFLIHKLLDLDLRGRTSLHSKIQDLRWMKGLDQTLVFLSGGRFFRFEEGTCGHLQSEVRPFILLMDELDSSEGCLEFYQALKQSLLSRPKVWDLGELQSYLGCSGGYPHNGGLARHHLPVSCDLQNLFISPLSKKHFYLVLHGTSVELSK